MNWRKLYFDLRKRRVVGGGGSSATSGSENDGILSGNGSVPIISFTTDEEVDNLGLFDTIEFGNPVIINDYADFSVGYEKMSIIRLTKTTSIGQSLYLNDTASLVTFEAPLLVTIGAGVDLNNSGLTTLILPSLVNCPTAFQNATGLSVFSCPVWLPTDGDFINFVGASLDAASINGILARCKAAGNTTSEIALQGGTNAAPSGQGIVDKADLITAGCLVTTN